MPAPEQGRIPDVVPEEWAAACGDERTERRLLLVDELDRIERASRSDASFLLAAAGQQLAQEPRGRRCGGTRATPR